MHIQTRIHSLDVIRGFAILGIFFVNWPSLVGIESQDVERAYTGIDAYVRLFYDLFIQTKFYTMFSFLFGLGFYIFMKRAATKTERPNVFFIRRLLVLFFFGALHFILFWPGDILHSYAIGGMFLLLFYHRSPRTIMTWALILLSCFSLLMAVAFAFIPHNGQLISTAAATPFTNWLGYVQLRWDKFFGEQLLSNVLYLPETVGLFLLGLYCGKKDVFRRAKELDGKLKIIQWSALLLTIPSWYKIIGYFQTTNVYNASEVFIYVLLSGKTLFVFYMISLLRIHEKWPNVLRPFQYVGRMALTNYLLQTILTMIIFSVFSHKSTALPLYIGIPFCFSIYILQIIGSKLWLSKFQYGPMEYIWRLGTYGKSFMPKQNETEQTTLYR